MKGRTFVLAVASLLESVLGKEMGPLLCFVQSITTQQSSCVVTLEEIELLSTEGATAAQPPP